MPVPVLRRTRSPAHPVVKKTRRADSERLHFHSLTHSLPVAPTRPPPSFGTREEWIKSLPTWRRTKPRRIWEDESLEYTVQSAQQDFNRGLTLANNAPVIKGPHAEACIPPQYNSTEQAMTSHELSLATDGDDEMSDYSATGRMDATQWPDRFNHDDTQMRVEPQAYPRLSPEGMDIATYDHSYEKGAFTPVFENQSPDVVSGPDDSSPLEPITPFGEFVDRVAAGVQPYAAWEGGYQNVIVPECTFLEKENSIQNYQPQVSYPPIIEQPKEVIQPALELITPSANSGYKTLAEPLSEWVAKYVWRVCTEGFSLPPDLIQPSNLTTRYGASPPSDLAASVHSLLLSTLLQPSAVFLAIWYIVRLPVYLGSMILGPEHVKETRFRAALLGIFESVFERENMEINAPFRLIVVGCMLANKWLDDHTFSNKTWHTISNVPIQLLNSLESLALDIFSYDLSIPNSEWANWLSHVQSYHMSLASPSRPQPISRPSSNPHSIVRKAIDEIVLAPAAVDMTFSLPQPVFLGLEERKREMIAREQAMAAEIDIDLDAGGPLKEEYLPRRRTHASSLRGSISQGGDPVYRINSENRNEWGTHPEPAKTLPPPAKWSPAGDEPILRDRNRISGQYLAVQPPQPASYAIGYPSHNASHNQNWNTDGSYRCVKDPSTYPQDLPTLHERNQFHNYPAIPVSHSRSHSLSYDPNHLLSRNHLRSLSQTRFEFKCGDISALAPEANYRWMGEGHYQSSSAFGNPFSNLGLQPSWLRV